MSSLNSQEREMFRKPAFLLVSLCEFWFGVIALLLPTPNDSHYFTSIVERLIPPQLFYLLLVFLAISFYLFYNFKQRSTITAQISVALSILWLLLILGVFDTQYFTTTLPLLIFMFMIRVLMAMTVEAERNGK